MVKRRRFNSDATIEKNKENKEKEINNNSDNELNTDDEEQKPKPRNRKDTIEEEKIDNFDEKCHMYNLGELDLEADNVILGNKTKKENKEMTELFNKIKLQLYDKTVTIDNILSLKNISELEKVRLVEKYCVMKNNENNLEEYIKYRDIMKEEITKISTMTSSQIQNKIKIDSEVKRL